jgi:hypothetical protein
MTPLASPKDLIVLAADLSMRLSIEELLKSHHSLAIRQISFDVRSHPNNDPGVFGEAHLFLQAQVRNYRHAMAVCDRQGCGREAMPRGNIESSIDGRLGLHWADRAAAIVIDPELETWLWTDSPHVARAVGWNGDMPSLRAWLQVQGLWPEGGLKPPDPKAALETVLRYARMQKSSSLFQSLAREVSLKSCACPAFRKFCATLQCWFPTAGTT